MYLKNNTLIAQFARHFILLHSRAFVLIFCMNLFLVFTPLVMAQDTLSRPKIGLVLSGGGSHGMSHLGVLKVMEEAGLRPDYITGVSMGSIIGGFYSIGYSPDSIQVLLKNMDWAQALSDKIPQDKIIFLEKRHFYNSVLALPITPKKLLFPAGLINGQQVENFLSYYAWPAAEINDFSKFPIPFLCLGTDILTGKKVILNRGFLPEAIRASIAIPSVFTPVKIDSALLVDGGVARNFAASEVLDMGADIVIGSYTGFQRFDETELESIDGIIMQVGFFSSIQDYEEQKKLADILIEPNNKGFSIMNFYNVDTIVERGYHAALPYKEKFRRMADSLNRIGPQAPVKGLLNNQFHTFDKIEVIGNVVQSDDQVIGVLNISPGEKVDKDLLSERMELLYGKAWFEKVKYRVVPRNDSLILVIDCIERPKAMLYGSVHFDDGLGSGLLLGISVRNLLTQRSVLNIDSYIGQYYRLRINSIQFIDRNEKYGLAADFFADNTLLPMVYLRGDWGRMQSRNISAGLSVNARIGLNHMMRLSGDFENRNLLPDFITHYGLKRLTYNYITAKFEYLVNTLDNEHFPDRGVKCDLSAESSKLLSGTMKSDSLSGTYTEDASSDFSFNRFYTLRGDLKYYFSVGGKTTFALRGEALYISNTDSVSAHDNFFLLGGIEPISKRSVPMVGFHPNEIAVKSLAGVGLDADIEILRDLHINLMTDVFAIQELDRDIGFSLLAGYGVGLGYMSVIGPLKVGMMQGLYSKEVFYKSVKGYVSIGFSF